MAETAHYERTIQTLTTQEMKARALTKAETEIARRTPIERQAATAGENQARARYQNGLANVTEVADAQWLLAQAEADDAVARLGVWRALLATAQAPVAREAAAAVPVGASNQHRHDDRAHVRGSREQRRGAVGERESWRACRRPH
jgi:hypothetical protein